MRHEHDGWCWKERRQPLSGPSYASAADPTNRRPRRTDRRMIFQASLVALAVTSIVMPECPAWAQSVRAQQFFTGDELLSNCTDADQLIRCMAYIEGISDALLAVQHTGRLPSRGRGCMSSVPIGVT